MRECPTCHLQAPDGSFCVRCGAPLATGLDHARRRSAFAAAPSERRNAPWLVSTLFPQLPHHSERHFHAALAAGAGLVIVLGVLRLFPVALISAAMLMPLLTILYFYDVDIYEGQPAWAIGWTLAWGAAAGVGVGLLARALESSGTSLLDRSSSAQVLLGGVLIPAIGVLAMLVGPLMLLRYRRFNETLDGAAFGAASAAAFAAAEAVVVGVGVLSGGLRPAGNAAPWVARLVGVAIASPVVSMSVIGAAAAALWLRYRAPAKDRAALGWAGTPAVALVLAVLLVIAGSVGETFMAAGVWLAWNLLLGLFGLLLLRRALHVGLLEEASEHEIGPEVRCANCAAMTPSHTFCADCGIALKALPKVRARTEGAAAAGSFGGRLTTEAAGRRSGRRRPAAAGTAIAVVAAIALVAAAIAAPLRHKPRCGANRPCGSPPILGVSQAVFPGYTDWRSPAYGYSLRFVSGQWKIANDSRTDVSLENGDGISTISFHAAPATRATPSELIDQTLTALRGQTLGLVSDTDPGDTLLGTGVGLRPGPGSAYSATTTTPQGPNTPVSIALMGATDGRLSIVVSVTASANDPDSRQRVYEQADDIVNSVRWGPS